MKINRLMFDELFRKDPTVKRLLFPSQDELCGLEEGIDSVRHQYESNPTDFGVIFEYASLLISHSRRSYVEEGARLMESFVYDLRVGNFGGFSRANQNNMSDGTQKTSSEFGVLRGDVVSLVPSAPPEEGEEKEHEEKKVNHVVGANTTMKSKKSKKEATLFDAYYYLTIAWIKMRDYEKALLCVNELLSLEPEQKQGIALKRYIDAEVAQTLTATGLAGVGIIAAAAVVVGMLWRK